MTAAGDVEYMAAARGTGYMATAQGTGSVSYTHLDVYKRQHVHPDIPDIRADVGELGRLPVAAQGVEISAQNRFLEKQDHRRQHQNRRCV